MADSEMTTHTHFGVQTDNPKELFFRFRYPYSRYFNNKYGRRGRLGERKPFILEVDGLQHSVTLLSYINRQGLHHGLSNTPFGYEHNSVNAVFQKHLGKANETQILARHYMGRFLPCPVKDIPTKYRMNKNGMLLREDVIDTSYVEELYMTPRNFLYQMNRLSSEEWKKEQTEDRNNLPPITLESVEPSCFKALMTTLLQNETGRNFRNDITDLELCGLIDNHYLKRFKKDSVYALSVTERNNLGNILYADFKSRRISDLLGRSAGMADTAQIRRCAVIL